MSLTVAMTELATRNLIAGTARLMSAVIVLLELVVGVALGERLASALVEVHQAAPRPLPEWAQWVALGASSLGAGDRRAGARACVRAGSSPRASSATSAAAPAPPGSVGHLGVLVGAFALGVLGNVYARSSDRPAQVVLVPAVLLLVPGSMGFRGMTSLLDRRHADRRRDRVRDVRRRDRDRRRPADRERRGVAAPQPVSQRRRSSGSSGSASRWTHGSLSGSWPHASTPGRRIVGIDALVRTLEIVVGVARRRRSAAGRDERRELLGRDVRDEALPRDVRDVVRVLAARLELAALDRLLERALEIADQPRRRDLERRP